MKSSDSLFKLVEALSKPEKRYFKLHASRNVLKGKNNYIELFDLISKFSEKGEAELKKYLLRKKGYKNYTETKYQLYNLILKSLSSFHDTRLSIDAQIREYMHQAEILLSKGLQNELKTLLKKAKNICYRFEKFAFMLDIIEMERASIITQKNFENLESFINRINLEKTEIVSKLDEINKIFNSGDELYVWHVKIGIAREKKEFDFMRERFYPLLFKRNEDLKTVKAKYFLAYARYLYGHMVQDKEMMQQYAVETMEILEINSFLMEENIGRYVNSLQRLAMIQSDMGQYEEFFVTNKKMKDLPEKVKSKKMEFYRHWIFEYTHYNEMDYYINTGQFKKGLEAALQLDKKLDELKGNISVSSEMVLRFNMANMFFVNKKYDLAIDYYQNIANDTSSATREDLQSMSRIMYLIIQFELDNRLLLPYAIKSAYRFLQKRQRMYQVEKIFIKYLQKLARLINPEELKKVFTDLKEDLVQLLKDPSEKAGLLYFDFISWLNSVIEKKELEEIIQRKRQSKTE